MQLTLIIAAISAALSGLAGFGLAWQLQSANITELNLKAANERIASDRASRAILERVTGQIAQAQNDATTRAAVLRRELDASRAAYDRVRNTSTATVRAASTSPDACPRIASTYDLVFTECTSALQTLAGDADQLRSDLTLMQDAWPK